MKQVFTLMCVFLATTCWAVEPLSTDTIASYLNASHQLEALFNQSMGEDEDTDDSQVLGNFTLFSDGGATLAAQMRASPVASQLERQLKPFGFDSIEAFTAMGARIIGAYMAVNSESAGVDTAAAMQQYQARMADVMGDMDEQRKAEISAMMARANQLSTEMAAAQSNATEADKKVVRDNLAWINKAFAAQGQ